MKIKLTVGKARERLAKFCKKISESNLVIGAWGNVSRYLPEEQQVVITPSGVAYSDIKPHMMVVVNMDGEVLEGELNPSSELKMHLAIYIARPDLRAVMHTHSAYASVLAVSGVPIPPIMEDMAAIIGDEVPVAEYALAGSEQLAVNTVKAMREKKAVLLANHGVVGVGNCLQEAMNVCLMVERCAQVYFMARQVGTPRTLSPADVATVRKFYLNKYGQTDEKISKYLKE